MISNKVTIKWDKKEYQIWIEVITPEKAEEYLQRNMVKNRKTSQDHIEVISEFIKMNHYDLNGVPIVFDDKHNLIDGQHRLKACILSQLPITTLCFSGVKTDCYFNFDQHILKRKFSDLLMGEGEKYSSTLSMSLQYLMAFKLNKLALSYNEPKIKDRRNLFNLYEKHPQLREIVSESHRMYDKSIVKSITPGLASFLLFIFRNIDSEKADKFIRTIYQIDGSENLENSPAFQIQRRLAISKNATQRSQKLSFRIIFGSLIKAWNLYIQGLEATSMKIIILRYDEEIPKILNFDGEIVQYKNIQAVPNP